MGFVVSVTHSRKIKREGKGRKRWMETGSRKTRKSVKKKKFDKEAREKDTNTKCHILRAPGWLSG